jgi:dipeptidyl aminopeptidase/acylaminoacyl peptidase
MSSSARRSVLAVALVAVFATDASQAQTATPRAKGYDLPPKNILDVLHAPTPPSPVVSPTGADNLLVSNQSYPPMALVAEPYLKLAGLRVEPRTRRKHDTAGGYGVATCAASYALVHVATKAETKVALPAGGCPTRPLWSADGKRFAFSSAGTDSVELWVGDAATGATHRVAGVKLNPMFGTSTVQWMPDQKHLLVKMLPANQGRAPVAQVGDEGPSIQESTGQSGESSTYETRDTLTNAADEALFDYYGASQLALVDVASGQSAPIGKPGLYVEVTPAPDGQHILVETLHRPYSYVTTAARFPRRFEVWDAQGRMQHLLADIPLADRVPVDGERLGPREYAWRSTEPATLVWAEVLDKGDWNVEVPFRDKVMMQRAPFTAPPVEITRTQQRYGGFAWGEDGHLALIGDYDINKRWTRTFTIDVDAPKPEPKVLFDLSMDELYANPGNPVFKQLPNGEYVLRQSGNSIYLSGDGASPDGDLPFLDRMDLSTKQTQRLFRSDKSAYEWFLDFTGEGEGSFLTWHQSPSDPPNAFLHAPGGVVPVTHIPDPTPAVRQIKQRLVTYKRADGVDLSFRIFTPPGYVEGTRVPTILYAYPLDYADPSKAGQVSGSQQTFTRLADYKLLLLSGYAIIDNASFPIIGDPKKAYDTYLEQLVADAKAAVDKAVEIGVADPKRIGVTGHSHGALMTVNLLAHSDLFRAGVATSGSYNKTLTPFGFQNERRSVWSAQPVYLQASPFFYADKLKLPLLLVHGAEDANPGTTPLQASKLYEAVRGNGGTVRLVMLPHEPHWYTAMESNEQLAFEEIRWFDKYVKNAK